MNILVTICARGGSKGIPGKNIKMMAGTPLIGYTIKVANAFAAAYNAVVALSTDDDAIKQTAAALGLHTGYTRSAHLASDTAGKVDTIEELVNYEEKERGLKFDYVLDLDVTSPLRTFEDLETAFKSFTDNKEAQTLFSVNNAARNPYFNMVEQKENGFYDLVGKGKDSLTLTRQSAPAVYDLNASFYCYRRSFFEGKTKSVITAQSMIYLMPHICFDLDHPVDFDFLEYLLINHKLGFEIK